MRNDFGIQRQFHEKQLKRRRVRLFLYLFSLAAAVYAPFFGGYLDARRVSVSGSEVIAPEAVEKVVSDMLGEPIAFSLQKVNLLLFSPKEAEERILAAFPRLRAADVSRKFLSREIEVRVSEREPAGVACDEQRVCFYFDEGGVLFAEAPLITGAAMLTVKETSLAGVSLPQAQYPAEKLAFMTRFKEDARERAGLTIDSFSLTNKFGDMEATVVEGFRILFTTEQDSAKQAQILKNLLAEEIKEQAARLDYIDLRVENRAYYKLEE